MIDFLYSVYDRVTLWFSSIYSRWYDAFVSRWFILNDYINSLYSNLRSVFVGYFNQLLWFVQLFYNFAYEYLTTLRAALWAYATNYAAKLVSFFNNTYNTLVNFVNNYTSYLNTIVTAWWAKLTNLINTLYPLILTLLTTWYAKLNTLVNTWYAQIGALVAGNILTTISTIKTDIALAKALITQWTPYLTQLMDSHFWESLLYYVNNPAFSINLVISDPILRPLSAWLTKLWYPHPPIKGE